jgi:hypothetical protein
MQKISTRELYDHLTFQAMHRRKAVWVHGAPGIGKSQIMKAWAKFQAEKMGLTFFEIMFDPETESITRIPEGADYAKYWGHIDLRAVLLDILDVKGAPFLDKEQGLTRFLRPSLLPDPKRHGKYGSLFLDELAQAFQSVTNGLSQLVLDWRIGDSYAFPGETWVILAAGNRKEDNSATQRAGAQIYNRFKHYELDPEVKDVAAWLRANGGDMRVAAFVAHKEELMHLYKKGDIVFPTPRKWEEVSHVVEECERLNVPQNTMQKFIAADVGTGPAAELITFLEVCNALPTYADIIADPIGCRVPTTDMRGATSAIYAVMNLLIRELSEPDMDAVMCYVNRLPELFQSTFVEDVKQLSQAADPQSEDYNPDPKLKKYQHVMATVAMNKWRADHPLVAV